jgi:hypothetical protein
MPRVAKKSTESTPSSSASVEKLASEVMSLLNADASAHKEKTTKKTQKIAVPSEPVEKKPKAVAKPVDGDAPASKPRKVFRPLTGENKEKIAELAGKEGVSKTEVRRMKSHLMLGKTWEEAHSIVQGSKAE